MSKCGLCESSPTGAIPFGEPRVPLVPGGSRVFTVEVVDAVGGPGGYTEALLRSAAALPNQANGRAIANLPTIFPGFRMAVSAPVDSGPPPHTPNPRRSSL